MFDTCCWIASRSGPGVPLRRIARCRGDCGTVRDYEGLDTIHIVPTEPGELSFSAGPLSRASIDRYAADLAAIGDALGPDGQVLLWSCHTAKASTAAHLCKRYRAQLGRRLLLRRALIGNASLGGRWELDTRSHHSAALPPLTEMGAAEYTNVLGNTFLANFTVTGTNGTDAGTYVLVRSTGPLRLPPPFLPFQNLPPAL